MNESGVPVAARGAVLGVVRAPFLVLPVTLVAAGAAAAAWEGDFSWPSTVMALVGLVALHAAVNAFNEVSDMRTGIDLATRRTPFSGGSGTLPAGGMTSRAALGVAVGATIAGAAIGVWFLARVGWRLLPVLVLGAVAVLLYTDVLARSGLGEIFAGLGLGGLPVWGSALVQGGDPGAAALAASVPATLMTFNLLLLNEFPDEEADRAGGRRNLVLLLGRPAAARAYAAAALATPASIVAAVGLGALPPLALAAVVPSLLLVRPLAWALRSPATEVPLPALAANVVWNLSTNAALAGALVAAAALRG